MISIAMTTYNGEKYIKQQLDSILNQTYTDIELIICDDCSVDNTLNILKEYSKKDFRIKIFKNENNLGFKKNFEKAISLCHGEYIALSDQDDIWTNTHLEILLKSIEGYSISCGNAEMIDGNGNTMNKFLNEVDGLLYIKDLNKLSYRIMFNSNCFQGASMLFKSNYLKKLLPIPDEIPFHDVWFSLCASIEKKLNYTFQVVTKYRQHGNNVTFNNHNKRKEKGIQQLKKYILFLKNGMKSDRLSYSQHLKIIYNETSFELNEISMILENLMFKRHIIKTLFWFWNNYEYIMTQKKHKKFIIHFIIWLKWKFI